MADIAVARPGAEGSGRTVTLVRDAGNVRQTGSQAEYRWLWYRKSLRAQILTAFVLANLLAGTVAAIVTVYDAREAAQIEIEASMRLAEGFVREAVERTRADTTGTALLHRLALQVGDLRHVRILVTDAGGAMTSLLPPALRGDAVGEAAMAPNWFAALVDVPDIRRELKIGVDGRQVGSVILIGHADDEIAEVWKDSKGLIFVAIILNLGIVAILYWALGRVLQPLASLAMGLGELERGQFRHRLSRPQVQELADIGDRFDALADSLESARSDNRQLTHRLITVQDDERRHIATELHDEFGPCLFGIKANVASFETFARELPASKRAQMRERIDTLSEITDKIQLLNRRLLSRIRPMALGHVPLTQLVYGLVADFERLNPAASIALDMGQLAHSYGDSIDLTIYRCLQEGITNAERHAGATFIAIELKEKKARYAGSRPSDEALSTLEISIRDDGRGMAAGTPRGFGLTGMDERLRALGGTLTISGQEQAGTRLYVVIPLDDARASLDGTSPHTGQRP